MKLKDLFKRKPGGTVVGNMIRGVASNLSGGLLGQGLMKLPATGGGGATKEDIAQAVGAAMETFNQNAPIDNRTRSVASGSNVIAASPVVQAFKSGVMKERLKKYWYVPAGVIGAILGFFAFRGRGGRKPRRR